MSKRVLRKAMAVVVCVAMLLGIIPVTWAGSDAYAAAQSVSLTNTGFEDTLLIPGWDRIYGDGTDFSVSNSVFHTGNSSLKVDDKAADGGKWMYGGKFNVTAGDSVSAKAWVKVEKGALELCLKYFDDAGKDVGTYVDTSVAVGDWSEQSVSGTVPVGATKAAIFIYSGMSAVTTAYVDDVTANIGDQLVTLVNPGFEDALTIPGWERIYGDGTDFSVSNSEFHAGAASLMVDDKAADGGKWMYGSKFSVNAGDVLTATSYVKVTKGTLEFCLKYFDNTGKEVGTYPDTSVAAGDWSLKTVSGTVPEGATKAAVFIYSGMSAVTTAYVDDVAVSVEPVVIPVDPYTVSLTNSNFEASAPVQGWSAVYNADSFTLSRTTVHSGTSSLEMIDKGASQSPMLCSELIPVAEGDKIVASTFANVAKYDGKSSYVDAIFSVQYVDADGYILGQAYGPDNTGNSGWTQYSTGELTIPAQSNSKNVAYVVVAFYGAGGGECKAYYDDVTVTKNGEPYSLFNSDFEQIPGWTVIDGSGSISLSSQAHSGSYSLEMIDTGDKQSPAVYSEIISVNPGDTVYSNCYANVASNGGSAAVDAIFSIWYVDANNNLLGQAYGPDIAANGGWKKYSSPEIVVPAQSAGKNVAGISIGLYGGGGSECKAYFDDVSVSVIKTFDSGITNPAFEAPVNTDGSITGWDMDDGATKSNFVIASGPDISYANNSPCLKMIDPDGSQSPWLYSNKLAANAGDDITVTTHMKVDSGYAELAIIYFDAQGNIFDSDWNWAFSPYPCEEIGATDGWTTQTVSGTIPDGAYGFRIFLWSGTGAVTTAYFDDFKYTVNANQSEKNPIVILDSDCSNLANMQSKGWTIDTPAVGNYTTDSTHSTGLGTMTADTIKTVPAGQTLFYMDSTAEDKSVGAFKYIATSGQTMIGADPWKAEFDMSFNALMTADVNDIQSGFSIVIDTGAADGLYRLNFDGGNDVRVQSSGWPDYDYIKKDIPFNIVDSTMHKWTVEGDGAGNITLYCDGSYIGDFQNVGLADSWGEPGVQFIDYNSNIGANKTQEVYVDNVRVTRYSDNVGAGVTAGTPVNLGAAVEGGQPLFLYSITERNTVTGKDELYTVTTGSQDNSSIFYAIDPSTGEMLFSQQIPGTVHNYGIVKGSDGKIYFEGCDTGILYRYTPAAKGQGTIEDLGENPCDTWVWDLAASDDGKIYGATSETDGGSTGAKVFEYDIATATFKDLGVVKAGATYARGLGVDGDYLYVGVGIPDALIQINRADPTQKTEISIPAYNGIPGTGTDGRMCGHVWSYNGKLFVRNNAMKLFVLDATTHELLNVLSFQQAIASPSPYNSNIIYYKSKNAVWQYDCSTNIASAVPNSPFLSGDASNALDWFTATTGAKAGRQLLGITDDAGGFVIYDPKDNTVTNGALVMQPQAVDIQSIEKGPDGKIYIGGYQFGGSVFDPETQTIIHNAPRLDQPEGIGFLNGKVYFGTYGSARVFSYDPIKDFNYSATADGNPGLLYDIGNDQDRPFALTSGDNKLFVGTIPDYGMLGGALTVYDEETNTWSEYRNIIKDQSITGLAYKDGKIYGGTSVAGGLGITSTAEQAKVFVWDVATGKLEKEATVSVPGLTSKYEGKSRTTPVMIGQMSFGKDGLLWTAVDGALVALDPDTLEVVKFQVLASMNYDQDSAWRPYYIRWGADGLLYTTIGRKVSVFNTETMGYDILTGYAGLATLGNDGNLYYASGSKLMMVPLTRVGYDDVYALNTAINKAVDAIDMLPGSYDIINADKARVAAVRALVNAAITAGASESDISNLSKLVACEAAASDPVVIGTTPTPTPTTEPTVTPTPIPETPEFKDLNGNWAEKAIMTLAKAGILSGYDDGTVKPNANASRAEFVNMIIKMMKTEAKNTASFTDINSSAWYMKAISAAVEKGWIQGRTDGSFGPNDNITREEAIVIISRIIDSLGVSATAEDSALSQYSDNSQLSSWARNDAAKLVGLGIIKGSDGKLNPKAYITRAEISAILVRILDGYINK